MSNTVIKSDHIDLAAAQNQSIHQAHIKPADGFELKPTQLAVHKIGKRVFGKIVPFYRLCVQRADTNKEILQSVDVPAARFEDALQLMKHAYQSDEKRLNEDFAQWGARKGYPFFTEMLEDILPIGPDDLPHLLNVDVNKDLVKDSGLDIV